MNKKHLFMALAVITTGAFVSVLAQTNFIKLPGANWFFSSPQTAKIKAPAFNASKPLVNAAVPNDYPTSGTFNNTLAGANVSVHQDGDLVLVMNAQGELPGTLTLKLHREADGVTISGGEWAFLVSYTEEIDNEDGSHSESLVQRGTIKGVVSGGQVTLDGGGAVSSINSVQMVVNGGTLTFSDADDGNGFGQMQNIQDTNISSGALILTF